MTETVVYPDGVTCEVRKPVADKRSQKLQEIQGDYSRMYVPEYHQRLAEAETVGEIVQAMRRMVSDMAGGHSNLDPELREKIRKACECREAI